MIGDPLPAINQLWEYHSRFIDIIQIYRIARITNGLVYMNDGTFYDRKVFTGLGNNWHYKTMYYPTRFEMVIAK